jgi:hypothetical protein
MEEFDVLCEKESGTGNYAAPYPCVTGEPFELKGVGLNWQSTLEVGAFKIGTKGPRRYYENFPEVDIEVNCMKSQEHNKYVGSLRPEVAIGRLIFRGPESGEPKDTTGHSLSFAHPDYIAPARYKDIRVRSDYEERLAIASLTPNTGPVGGGTAVTVLGSGFALGTETIFDFGKAAGSSVNCLLTTECTVLSPAGEAGTVNVTATVGGAKSKTSESGNQYTYH